MNKYVCNNHNTYKICTSPYCTQAYYTKHTTCFISTFNSIGCLYQWLSNFSDHRSQ